jgi:hypothetical protein
MQETTTPKTHARIEQKACGRVQEQIARALRPEINKVAMGLEVFGLPRKRSFQQNRPFLQVSLIQSHSSSTQ